MRAWAVARPGPIASGPLQRVTVPDPTPAPGELLVRVLACGVCRTDLHLAEGDVPPRAPRRVPGHEVVGRVVAAPAPGSSAGSGARPQGPALAVGALVGVAWLRSTCGACRYCVRGEENLCRAATFTGWDADGGYADYLTVPAAFAHRLPQGRPPHELAPLLCAGIIGYRALRRTQIRPGGALGIYGFGASAHLTAQVAMAEGHEVHVMTRSPAARELALELGCASAGGAADPPPVPLDAAILFAPAGELVPVALGALDHGGTLVIAGIHLSQVPALDYQASLFYERSVRTVTANTRADARELLELADRHPLRVAVTPYPFEQADRALADLAADRVNGVAVLDVAEDGPASA